MAQQAAVSPVTWRRLPDREAQSNVSFMNKVACGKITLDREPLTQ